MDEYLNQFQNLAIALALGLLIGLERGWEERTAEPGTRVAGIRTFGLISLLGALWQLLALESDPIVLGLAFMAFTLAVISVSFLEAKRKKQYGVTTSVAALVAFAVGALAMGEHTTLAAAVAVFTMTLLGLKPVLHSWVRKLEPQELYAVFRLLLISLVLLPILPNRSFGPWEAFNPYEIWWMVVLVSAISFAGYFAIKIAGPSRGLVLTGLFGGLASSTAVALSLSRLGKKQPGMYRLLAAGITVSSTTMFPRMLLVVAILQPTLLKTLAWPLGLMSLVGYAAVWWDVTHCDTADASEPIRLKNPFEFGVALQFGALLALIMLFTRILKDWLGSAGIYLMAAVSGLSDVDAITLSLARLANAQPWLDVAGPAIVLAAMVNTAVKAAMTALIAGGALGKRIVGLFSLLILAGVLGLIIDGLNG